MVAFMCVIVTYPKVTAPKRHHPSPACPPHASFCLTDSLKLCLFALKVTFIYDRARPGQHAALYQTKIGRKSIGNLLSKIVYICQIAYYEDNSSSPNAEALFSQWRELALISLYTIFKSNGLQ